MQPARLPALILTLPFLLLAAQPPATLTVHTDKVTGKVSPTLYGLMTEEINFSYDGGLYGELVRNRTFRQGWSEPEYWTAIEHGNSTVSMALDTAASASPERHVSLKLEVSGADAMNTAGVQNDGYWGIPVRPNTTYKATIYAKAADDNTGPLTASLVSDATGQVLASGATEALSSAWKPYSLTLTTHELKASSANHLVLTVAHPGTLWLDFVSLFGPTYKNRANGNRIDLMEKLAAMKPAFLRFPGGNYLEGDHIAERFEWKKTIGPVFDRPTHPSPWHYRSSDGLGLLEFLEWCEDLNMKPLLAVYAGYSMAQEVVKPGPYLQPYVQDALDEIEYVSGDQTTKWGAIRAQNGHPAPFPFDWVEVGNEDNFDKSGLYDGRFAQFFDAIKQKYPNLKVIATTPVTTRTPDAVDDHYYKRADEFYSFVHHYDTVGRNGSKIFVGEWATREGSPTPNFGAALGDAAWMTAMERNSDLIVMASYAPLLVNVNPGGMQWSSDLIGYDALSSYGSPSYYAQVLFNSHLGTEIVDAQMETTNTRLFYSATRNSAKGIVYLKVVNASSTPQPLHLKLDGASSVASKARLYTLTGTTTAETNTLLDPKRIVPVESTIQDAKAEFTHNFAPYSISILELDVK